MLRIRLARTGKKRQPSYRVVVAEKESPRDGRYVEQIGFYNPMTDPITYKLKEGRALHWLSVGAQPSDAVRRLLDKQGTFDRLARMRAGESAETLAAEIDGVPAAPEADEPAVEAAPVAEEAAPVVEEVAAEAVEEVAVVAEEPAAEEAAVEAAPAEDVKPDDLKKIEGIGPKVAELLAANGIPTFDKLANTSAEDVSAILTEAGGVYASMNPESWAQQAWLAAAGSWDELKTLQDQLDGGRIVS